MSLKVQLHFQTVKKLNALCRGATPARITKRARILLALHQGHSVDEAADLSAASTATVKRVRRRCIDDGWERAIADGARPGRPRITKESEEKALIALACTKPPDGHNRWSIRLLAQKSGQSFGVVRRIIREDGLKPWREKNVVYSGDKPRVQKENV